MRALASVLLLGTPQPALAADTPDDAAARRLADRYAPVKGRWWRTAGPLAIIVGLGLAVGPIAGIVLLLATGLPAALINLVSSLLFALAMPLASAAVIYLYLNRAVIEPGAPEAPESPESSELTAGDRDYSHDGPSPSR